MGSIHPTHGVAAEDSRSCTSRGSSTFAASSVRYRALEARVKAELHLARARETELLRQLHAARAFPAPFQPAPGDSRTAVIQVSSVSERIRLAMATPRPRTRRPTSRPRPTYVAIHSDGEGFIGCEAQASRPHSWYTGTFDDDEW